MAEKKVVKAEEKKPVKKATSAAAKSDVKKVEAKAVKPNASVKKEVVEDKAGKKVVKAAPTAKSDDKVKLQQIASSAGHTKSQIATLKGLNLNKIGKTVELENTSAVRGMIEKVKHLLRIFK